MHFYFIKPNFCIIFRPVFSVRCIFVRKSSIFPAAGTARRLKNISKDKTEKNITWEKHH